MGYLAKTLFALLVVLLVAVKTVFATDNLLQNPDFEQNANSSFPSWSKTPSTLSLSTATVSSLVHSGNAAASLKSQTTSTKYLYQVYSSPSGTFKFSAWLRLLNPNQTGFIRISWYQTSDGSGTEISSSDSPAISSVGDWQKVEVISQTPATAHSLRAKLALDPNSSDTLEVIFDDATLEVVNSIPGVSFTITLPNEVETGEEFPLAVSVKGLSPSSKYFVKVLGDQNTKLTGELFNFYTWCPSKNIFLTWNASWSDFPSLITDLNGAATADVKGKFTSDSFIGENKIVVRLRKEGTTVNLDSDAVAIVTNQPEATQIKVDNGKEETVVAPFLTTANRTLITPLEMTAPLGTVESALASTDSGFVLSAEIPPLPPLSLVNSPGKTDAVTTETTSFPWEIPLLLTGGVFLGGSLLIMVIRSGGWTFVRGIFLSE